MHPRLAVPEDAAAIGLVHVRSWQAAYHGLLPQAYLDGLQPERSAAGWLDVIRTQTPPKNAVLVVEGDDELIGFASIGAQRGDDETGSETGELTTIYVRPESWGCGAGRQLMAEALAIMKSGGYGEATLWVLAGNARARRFYEATGRMLDGPPREENVGGTTVTEFRYRIAL